MKPRLIFDVETGPVSDSLLKIILPPFNPDDVKLGNLKDPLKIQVKIEEARASYSDDMKKQAALNAMTGQVLAVGLMVEDKTELLIEAETEMLQKLWERLEDFTMNTGGDVVGWRIHDFDLPFTSKRSLRYRIKPPTWLREGRYWSRRLVDLHEVWMMGERRSDSSKRLAYSLGNVSAFLGLGSKNGNGAEFADLLKANRALAEEYLVNDLTLTSQIADVLL